MQASRTENFSDFANLGAFYKAGLDYLGRQIIIFIGRQFAAPKVDPSKVCVCILSVYFREREKEIREATYELVALALVGLPFPTHLTLSHTLITHSPRL